MKKIGCFSAVATFLVHDEDLEFPRQIYMDGRAHPGSVPVEEMDYMGHSIGHWEGDTLVVGTRSCVVVEWKWWQKSE